MRITLTALTSTSAAATHPFDGPDGLSPIPGGTMAECEAWIDDEAPERIVRGRDATRDAVDASEVTTFGPGWP